MRHYIGVVHKDADSDYGISFPDFPGAVTAARTIDEAVEMAEEALALHVEGMLAEGQALPSPSNFDQVRAEPEFSDGLPLLVPLKTDALAMRVNVTLPAAILRRIDEYVERQGLTRSGFLATAALRLLSYGAPELALRNVPAPARHRRPSELSLSASDEPPLGEALRQLLAEEGPWEALRQLSTEPSRVSASAPELPLRSRVEALRQLLAEEGPWAEALRQLLAEEDALRSKKRSVAGKKKRRIDPSKA
jgi:predicted RNase H-like HicB family nuclease